MLFVHIDKTVSDELEFLQALRSCSFWCSSLNFFSLWTVPNKFSRNYYYSHFYIYIFLLITQNSKSKIPK